jgi:copper chaperone CopZ
MTHTYQLSGLTCANCEAKVRSALLSLPDITDAEVTRNSATITMSRHVALTDLQQAISKEGNYTISAQNHSETAEQAKSWFGTYKPVLLVFIYITVITGLIQAGQQGFNAMEWMRHFMAGFFLVFSFFKMLDLKGFAESYTMYDVIAKRFQPWAYLYPFIELGLGLAFLINFNPLLTNLITVAVMGISIIGVLQSVINKRKIQCACLGAVFNLPMSTITIIEDALMIAMSGITLVTLLQH